MWELTLQDLDVLFNKKQLIIDNMKRKRSRNKLPSSERVRWKRDEKWNNENKFNWERYNQKDTQTWITLHMN